MASRRKREQQAAAAAAAAAVVRKPTALDFAGVIALVVVAMIAAFVLVPIFARQSGLHERHWNYAMAAAAVLIGIVTTKWIRSLQRRAADSSNSVTAARRSR